MTKVKGMAKTEIVFILDRSGSMTGSERAVTGGFREMLEKQQHIEGEAWVTTVLFNDELQILHDHVPLMEVRPIGEMEYEPSGCTALLDALGKTIHWLGHNQKTGITHANRVIFVIMTDGYENASQEYTFPVIQKLIGRQKECYGWEFIFMGANMDAVAEASRYGIEPSNAMKFKADAQGFKEVFSCMDACVKEIRMGPKSQKTHKKRNK